MKILLFFAALAITLLYLMCSALTKDANKPHIVRYHGHNNEVLEYNTKEVRYGHSYLIFKDNDTGKEVSLPINKCEVFEK